MAKQAGIIHLTGSIGNLSFYKSQDGYLVRTKSGVSGDRIKSDPAYARTRENIAEFRRAVLATKLLRTSFRSFIQCAVDNRVSGRLTGAIVKVIQGDTLNPRGERTVIEGKAALLEGFEFNKNSKLTTTFSAPFSSSIDRATGTLIVDVPAFIPANVICAPAGATHFRLKVAGAAIDFGNNTYSVSTSESVDLRITQQIQGPIHFRQQVTPDSVHPMFLVFGIEFLQSVNDTQYPLNNSAFNAMTIVKVDGCAIGERQIIASGRKAQFPRKNGMRIPRRAMISFSDLEVLGIRRGSSLSPEESAKNPRDGPVL